MVYPALAEGRKLLLGVCCNTFHDEPTFRPFLQRLREPWKAGIHARHFAVNLTGGGLEDNLEDSAATTDSAHTLDVDVVNMPLQVTSLFHFARMEMCIVVRRRHESVCRRSPACPPKCGEWASSAPKVPDSSVVLVNPVARPTPSNPPMSPFDSHPSARHLLASVPARWPGVRGPPGQHAGRRHAR